MAKRAINNIKLGIFALAGLLFLVLLMYMIGKNRNIFGSTYTLKTRFENVQGLVPGNNVRFAGIGAGTVKRIRIINDTSIEVTMIIDEKMKTIIRKDAIASIGTDGLVGNKVVNILPSGEGGPLAEPGDVLPAKRPISTEEILQTLNNTNRDVAYIASQLKITVQRINGSEALWSLLGDPALPKDLRQSVANIRTATGKANEMVINLNDVVLDVKNGKGSLGAVIKDTSFANNLNDAILKMGRVGAITDSLVDQLRSLVVDVHGQVASGKGTVNLLLKDSVLATHLRESLANIEKGTAGFNQNMEALKHNFLFRGYFRKLERQRREINATASGK